MDFFSFTDFSPVHWSHPDSFFFFSPFLPGYWLCGDISCSFVYIGDHLQDL